MKKISIYLIVCTLSFLIGYSVKSVLYSHAPYWRWVIVNNTTQCRIQAINLIMKDRTVSANRTQLSDTKYPYSRNSSESYLPLLVSENEIYQIEINFSNCQKIISKNQNIAKGMYIFANILDGKIEINNR